MPKHRHTLKVMYYTMLIMTHKCLNTDTHKSYVLHNANNDTQKPKHRHTLKVMYYTMLIMTHKCLNTDTH